MKQQDIFWPDARDFCSFHLDLQAVAQAYLEFLYSEPGQALAAKHYYRPRSASALAGSSVRFPRLTFVTIDEVFGGWAKAQKTHFADGGVFDQIYQPGR